MTPKTDFFKKLEKFCKEGLDVEDKKELETELNQDPEFKKEFELACEVQKAIEERDIIDLRDKLKKIKDQTGSGRISFNILDGFDDIHPLSSIIPPEELLQLYDSLPKAHIYQHELITNENIHEFFREQDDSVASDLNSDEETFFQDQEDEPEGLDEALMEKDILDLRDSLSLVSEAFHDVFSTETIDKYLNHDMEETERKTFNRELAVNSHLQREVHLHDELESALREKDVIELRDKLSRLMAAETSWNVTGKQIEGFIEGTLSDDELKVFRAEWDTNPGLRAEVILRRKVNEALAEKNVISLRDHLQQVKKKLNISESKSLVPEKTIPLSYWWKAGVAVVLVLFAFTGIIRSTHSIDSFYQSPQWSPQRSVVAHTGYLQEANNLFMQEKYEEALSVYDKALSEVHADKYVFQFYKAASLQHLEKYEDAIIEYGKVITQGNNLFVEEAEWYRALCILKLGKKELARKELLAIAEKKGFYAQKARAIIRKTRFLPR